MLTCYFEQYLGKKTYILSHESKQYKLKIHFLNIEKPKRGDKILINTDLLEEATSHSVRTYVFKLDRTINPQIVQDAHLKDFIVVKVSNQIYVLKRVYG